MFLLNIAVFVIIFGVLVFIHELGHFLAARRYGIVAEEFGFGFPPRVITLFRGAGKLVIGGREVKVPRGFRLPADLAADSLVTYEATTDRRGRAVLQCIEVLDPEQAPPFGADVRRVQLVDPGTIYSINLIPLGGFVRMRGEDGPAGPGSFASASRTARAVTLLAGPAMNFVLAILLFAFSFMLGRPEPVPGGRIVEIAPGSPAEAVGLQVGDRIFQIDDQTVVEAGDLARYIEAHPGRAVTLLVKRGDQTFTVQVTPRLNPPPGQGYIGLKMYPVTEIQRYDPLQSLVRGTEDTARFIRITLSVPALLMRGVITPEEARPIGPKGIYDLTSSTFQQSLSSGWWFPILQLMGILSAALAITNLLPLPALDGGRLLFVLIEQIRGRRIDPQWEGAIHLAGMVFLLGLMVLITYQDFASPVSPPDWLAPLGN
ncbi:MAG: M50 family metallopeptidase [Caldilineales bacterium]|nr:M50 family metallopeptidase [Caldilineales bacterium]MDW8317233.1 M50 family metallopeptidase [Anaerolineae bacterium]